MVAEQATKTWLSVEALIAIGIGALSVAMPMNWLGRAFFFAIFYAISIHVLLISPLAGKLSRKQGIAGLLLWTVCVVAVAWTTVVAQHTQDFLLSKTTAQALAALSSPSPSAIPETTISAAPQAKVPPVVATNPPTEAPRRASAPSGPDSRPSPRASLSSAQGGVRIEQHGGPNYAAAGDMTVVNPSHDPNAFQYSYGPGGDCHAIRGSYFTMCDADMQQNKVYDELIALRDAGRAADLVDLCDRTIAKVPDWLAPMAFKADAYIRTGRKVEGLKLMQEVADRTRGNGDYKKLLDYLNAP